MIWYESGNTFTHPLCIRYSLPICHTFSAITPTNIGECARIAIVTGAAVMCRRVHTLCTLRIAVPAVGDSHTTTVHASTPEHNKTRRDSTIQQIT